MKLRKPIALLLTATMLAGSRTAAMADPNIDLEWDRSYNQFFLFPIDGDGGGTTAINVTSPSIQAGSIIGGDVAITVNVGRQDVNHDPDSTVTNASTPNNTPITFSVPTLDADGHQLTRVAALAPTDGGTLSFASGEVTFTPNPASSNLALSFVLLVGDGHNGYGYEIFNVVEGTPSDPMPTAVATSHSVTYGTPLSFEPQYANGSAGAVLDTGRGGLTGTDLTLTYTPSTGLPGNDVMVFTVTNGANTVAQKDSFVVSAPPVSSVLVHTGGMNGTVVGTMTTSYGTPSGTLHLGGLSDGPETLYFVAQDQSGGTGVTALSVIIDNTPPTCVYKTPDTPLENAWVARNISFTVTSEDQVSGVQGVNLVDPVAPPEHLYPYVRVNGTSDWVNQNYDTRLLADGTTEFASECYDGANNVSARINRTVHIDNTAPATAIALTPPAVGGMRGIVSVSVSGNDGAGSGVAALHFKLDGNELSSTFPYNLNTAAYADGNHTLSAVAADLMDNVGSISQAVVFDNTAPLVAITSPAEGALVSGSLTQFQATVTDANAIAAKNVSIDGAPVSFTQSGNTYTIPAVTGNGLHTLTFQATDSAGNTGGATRLFVLTGGVNRAPVAQPTSRTVLEDTPLHLTMTATDADGDPLSYAIVANPSHGVLGAKNGAAITYTPATNYNGPDSFSYKANDSSLDSNTAVFSLTVSPVNDAPAAGNQNLTTNEDASLALTLTATDGDGDALTYGVITQPSHGTLTGTAPNLTYTPSIHYHGADTLTFKANDGSVDSNAGTISITVNHVNHAPTAIGQQVSTPRDVAKNVTLTATDVDTDPITFMLVGLPAHGSLSGAIPSLVYTPVAGYMGADSFTFKANDGTADSAIVAVNVTVFDPMSGGNNSPQAENQATVTNEDTPKVVTLTAADIENDPLTFTVVGHPAHGVLSGVAPSVTYTPALHYYGTDSFTFKANDGFSDSNIATVLFNVIHVNHAPIANAQSVSTLKNKPKAVMLAGSDVDNDSLTYIVVAAPVHGVLTGTAPNLTYTPALNYVGADGFTFKINDGTVNGNTAAVDITVTAGNNAPIAVDGSASTPENQSVAFALTASDLDQDALAYTVVNAPAHGTLSGTAPNLTYTPSLNYNGTDTLTFKVNDGSIDSNPAAVLFTVTPVNQPPQIQFLNPTNGGSIGGTVQLLVYVSDDGGSLTGINGYINGGAPQPLVNLGGGVYALNVNTNTLPAGSNTLQVTATDSSGVTSSSSVTVTVDNTPPTISTVTPADGSSTSGVVQIGAGVLDNNGIGAITFTVDGVTVLTMTPSAGTTSANPTYSWDTTNFSNGTHTVVITVTDLAGNTRSSSNNIIVNNGPGGLPVVTVLKPKTNDAISAATQLVMTAGANILSAGFRIDGGAMIPASASGTDEFSALLNTTLYADGFHNIDSLATNAAGSTFETAHVYFDNTPPLLSVETPTANQTIFLVKNIVVRASDASGLPLASVRINLNGSSLAFFPGHADVANQIYSYTLDTTGIADGNYNIVAFAVDKAGNQTQVSVPIRIDNANVPLSDATVIWTPAAPFAVGANETAVSATVSNATVEPTSVTNAALQVIVTKDGQTSAWPGSVQLVGNTLKYLSTVPSNARVHCVLNVLDTNGNVIRQTHDFISGMSRLTGGMVTILPEALLKLSVPANALKKDALVEMKKMDASQAPELSLSDGDQIVYGPITISAAGADGVEMIDLDSAAQMRFERSVQSIPEPEKNGYIDQAQKLIQGSRQYWKSLGGSGNSALTKNDAPTGVRTINVSVEQFGVFRITAQAVPGEGISNLINMPNPFSPSEGGTDFSYLLGSDSEVNLVLYDLLGNLVRRIEIGAGNQGGKFGQNVVHWDGRNGVGDVVANGGYILLITAKDSSGRVTRARYKVAVVK